MKALVYHNTKSTIPHWPSIHEKQERGIAYEADKHFVHIYGIADHLWTISNGLTVTDNKTGSLTDWVKRSFGAENIEESNLDVGVTVEGVWRPGLYYDNEMLQGLGEAQVNLRLAEQALLLLIKGLTNFYFSWSQQLNRYKHIVTKRASY